jgi:1,2-phenylacetyl-CoA epoxidase catalytic subunit
MAGEEWSECRALLRKHGVQHTSIWTLDNPHACSLLKIADSSYEKMQAAARRRCNEEESSSASAEDEVK